MTTGDDADRDETEEVEDGDDEFSSEHADAPEDGFTIASSFRLFTFLLGLGMFYELTGGKYPKFNRSWVDGTRLEELAGGVVDGSTWSSVAFLLREVVVPNAMLISIVVMVLQILVAASLLAGAFVRLIAILGLPMFIAMNVGVQTLRTPQWYITGLLIVIIVFPHAVYGVDRYLTERLEDEPARWATIIKATIALDFRSWFEGRRFSVLLAVLVGAAALSVMYMASLADQVLRLTMLEAATYAGLLGAAVFIHRTATVSTHGIASTLLRVTLGKAALWPILSDTSVKTTALPGFADPDKTAALLTDVIGATHWEPLAALARDVLAPNALAFVTIAGAIQLTIGICLIVGYQLNWIRWAALGYFAVACLIGFTRTTQYAVMFSLLLVLFGTGWELSLDRLLDKPRPQLRIPDPVAATLAAVSVVAVIQLMRGSVSADPYNRDVSIAVFTALMLTVAPVAIMLGAHRYRDMEGRNKRLGVDSGVIVQVGLLDNEGA